MAFTTAADMIGLALKSAGILGVGQTALAEDANDALNVMNMMLGDWSSKRWLVYHLLDTVATSTGALSYTIGAGGTFNTPRPDKIEGGFIRINPASGIQSVDYPLEVIEAREDYNRISVKSVSAFSQFIFYDSDFPLGNVFFWPAPVAGLEMHVTTKAALAQFASLRATINLPAEYFNAIFYNLTCRLRSLYQAPPDPVAIGLATAGLQTIRTANTQVRRLVMPPEVGSGAGYNIYSDR